MPYILTFVRFVFFSFGGYVCFWCTEYTMSDYKMGSTHCTEGKSGYYFCTHVETKIMHDDDYNSRMRVRHPHTHTRSHTFHLHAFSFSILYVHHAHTHFINVMYVFFARKCFFILVFENILTFKTQILSI